MTEMQRFRNFIREMTHLVERTHGDERLLFQEGRPLLKDLVEGDDWLPQRFAQPHPEHYQQNLLYCDPLERFTVLGCVWGPGQCTAIHDHTLWGMVGGMWGEEFCEEFEYDGPGKRLVQKGEHFLHPGDVDLVSPRIGDIHRSQPQDPGRSTRFPGNPLSASTASAGWR